MKHIYYGVKKEIFHYLDTSKIYEIDNMLRWRNASGFLFDRYKEEIESEIENLKEGFVTKFIRRSAMTVGNMVFIKELNHDHVCEVNDDISIGKYRGKILSRDYDAINDTMKYCTDVVVINLDNRPYKNKLMVSERERNHMLEILVKIHKVHFSKKYKKQVDNGFWSRIFG